MANESLNLYFVKLINKNQGFRKKNINTDIPRKFWSTGIKTSKDEYFWYNQLTLIYFLFSLVTHSCYWKVQMSTRLKSGLITIKLEFKWFLSCVNIDCHIYYFHKGNDETTHFRLLHMNGKNNKVQEKNNSNKQGKKDCFKSKC